MGDVWGADDKAENHWRRTFCQIPFGAIYEQAETGKKSLHRLVEFFQCKADGERTASEELRNSLRAHMGTASLEELEEEGTSIRKALMELHSYVDATCTHQLLLAKVLQEQIAEPLMSLQAASEVYIRTLEGEIKSVNDEYTAAYNAHKQEADRLHRATEDLVEARERQRNALHSIGVPEFELQRLAARVAKCDDERAQAELRKARAKTALYNRIVARDEMAMAVSVAYQRAEEERLDQLNSCLKRFSHVEKERLKVLDKMLASLETHIDNVNRSEDIQLLIHNRRNPDNMHFQGKALALMDWHWGKLQSDRLRSKKHGLMERHTSSGENGFVTFDKQSTKLSDRHASDLDAVNSAHGALAHTPIGTALRPYFASEPSSAATVRQLEQHQFTRADMSVIVSDEGDVDDGDGVRGNNTQSTTSTEPLEGLQTAVTERDEGEDEADPFEDNSPSGKEHSLAFCGNIIKNACKTPSGRAMFVKCLNRQRSLETKIKDKTCFDGLVDCFNAFLDECMREDDVKAAKTAMILAETFYCRKPTATANGEDNMGANRGDEKHNADDNDETQSDPNLTASLRRLSHGDDHPLLHTVHSRGVTRMYLQEEVKKHAIWKNPSFWEKALLLALGEELQKTPQPCPWEDLPTGVSEQDGVPTREEAVARVHNIVFGQLGSFTLSMLEFEVPLPQIESFVETMCDAHELTEDQRFLLRKNLQEIFAALR